MLVNIILLFLFAGVPYYLYFEKTQKLKHEKIFFLSVFLLLCGIGLSSIFPRETSEPLVILALFSALFSIYKASRTSNLHKVSYYMLFINAPLLMMFDLKQSVPYSISLLIALFGIYFIGKHYERNYGSANYHSVSGTTLVTPYSGIFLTIYLITLALYPPFPNAIFFLGGILTVGTGPLWYVVVVVIFFGNFILAMRIMAKTVFGKPNNTIHYVDLAPRDTRIHFVIVVTLLLLSFWGFREALV